MASHLQGLDIPDRGIKSCCQQRLLDQIFSASNLSTRSDIQLVNKMAAAEKVTSKQRLDASLPAGVRGTDEVAGRGWERSRGCTGPHSSQQTQGSESGPQFLTEHCELAASASAHPTYCFWQNVTLRTLFMLARNSSTLRCCSWMPWFNIVH